MSKVIKLKKGLDINLKGQAEKTVEKTVSPTFISIKPSDFPCVKPHLEVRQGDKVKAGDVLFTDKFRPEIRFCSPVSGEVAEIRRAERRRITDVIVKADSQTEYSKFEVKDLNSKDAVKELFLKSGVWPYLRQRPFNIIADPQQEAKAVYISTFDSAPLAADYQFVLKDQLDTFQAGVDALSKLAKVYIGLDGKVASNIFANVKNAESYAFEGPHPAGNAGVQISYVCPVNKGESVIVVNPQDVVIIGRLVKNGIYDAKKTIALAGSKVKNPAYVSVVANSNIDSVLEGKIDETPLEGVEGEAVRIIGGNVLTGTKLSKDGFLGFYDNEITIIPEGKYYDFFGWALPGLKKYSFSHTFFSWLCPKKQYELDTNMHGEKRAYVVTGTFEKLVPMDILPLQLIKAILAQNIELMEELGIYEVAEEDFALCEFADTSKTDIQAIIRKGLDLMVSETR
ncbi:MAG: Na(+)-translocating NADH-quinone reductase subunit A [Bacteroidales bacterium]|nr:Na(+)-translocating NADH-quinone reductase subunit A [Bacteroidales bacterium]